MPRIPLIGECHGGIPFAKHFRNSIHQLGELLNLLGGKVLTKTRVQSPARFDFVAGDIGHDTDEFDLVSCLPSWRPACDRIRFGLADGEAAGPAYGGCSPLRIAMIAGTIAVAHNVAADVIWGLSATPRASATRPPKASNMAFWALLSSVIENR